MILFAPIFLIVLYFAVEIGNIWVARGELETTCEAAALAAVKTFRDTGSTSLPRDVAIAYAKENPVSGQTVILDDNYQLGGDANDNESCAGEIVLGEITGTDCSDWEFDPDATPGGVTGTYVSLTVEVLTNTDTKNDIQNGHYSFRIYNFSSSNTSLEIDSVSFNIATVPPADDEPGYFDLRIFTSGGTSTDRHWGLTPIYLGTNVTGHAFLPNPDPLVPKMSSTFEVHFTGTGANAFNPGLSPAPSADRFDFSVDTDLGGPDPGTGDNKYADKGGELVGMRVVVHFRLAGLPVGTVSGNLNVVLDPLGNPVNPEHLARVVFNNQELRSGNYGVRVQRQFSFDPLCKKLLGIPATQFHVRAEVTAMCEGASGAPKLVRIDNYLCP